MNANAWWRKALIWLASIGLPRPGISDFKVTPGVSKYTGRFEPPTHPFPGSDP